MIHLKDINKTYQGAQPLHVLKGISLDIAKGEFVSIMGASGCRLISSLLRPPWKTLSCHYFIRGCPERSAIRWL